MCRITPWNSLPQSPPRILALFDKSISNAREVKRSRPFENHPREWKILGEATFCLLFDCLDCSSASLLYLGLSTHLGPVQPKTSMVLNPLQPPKHLVCFQENKCAWTRLVKGLKAKLIGCCSCYVCEGRVWAWCVGSSYYLNIYIKILVLSFFSLQDFQQP